VEVAPPDPWVVAAWVDVQAAWAWVVLLVVWVVGVWVGGPGAPCVVGGVRAPPLHQHPLCLMRTITLKR